MPLSATTEYGLRCALQLARLPVGAHIAASEISTKEGLSVQYVSKLLHILRKEGLVEGVRGQCGGFRLSRHPGEIPLLEVIRALEPDKEFRDICNQFPGSEEECVHSEDCGMRPLWELLFGYFENILEKLTLLDISASEIEAYQKVHQTAVLQADLLQKRLAFKEASSQSPSQFKSKSEGVIPV